MSATTGTVMYARHADGLVFEYLQYTADLAARIAASPPVTPARG